MKGYIYKISNTDESIVYIGSTIQTLEKRWISHKSKYKQWIEGKCRPCAIFHQFKEHGIGSFKIDLLSEHDIDDRKQIFEFEQLTIDRTECVNRSPAFRTDEQKQQNRLQYTETNRATINAKVNERGGIKVICECGMEIRKDSMNRHKKRKYHTQRLSTQN